MPQSKILGALVAAGFALALSGPAHADRSGRASTKYSDDVTSSDLHARVSRSYASERRHARRAAYRAQTYRKLAYPNGPWGPFAGPPGLF